MQQDWGIIFAFGLYFLALFGIGIFHMKKEQDLAGYVLGGRKVGPWVSLMGLPGYAYVAGVSAFWIAIGLAIGTWLNWLFVAKRLRVYTKIANDSITLPDFFENRFRDKTKILRVVSAIFIFIFFLIYTASGFVAGGRLFNTVFGLPYFPVTGIFKAGGPVTAFEKLYNMNANYFSFFTDATGVTLSATAIISLLAWGLGYFGQPHILVRFMGISSAKEIPQATRIAMVWVIFSLFFAVTVGLVGRVLLGDTLTGVNAETVFMVLNNEFFVSFLAGIIISAILGAIMSTSSSQLLVTASAISTDFYQALLRKNAGEKELVFVSRLSVILVACCSLALASNPNNYILELVAYAWAGFGASFGPLVLFSLFWRRTTIKGAIAGVFFGGSTVLIWKEFFAYTGIYEIVPGFIISALAIYVVSLLDKKPDAAIVKDFDVAEAHIQDM